MIISMGDFIEFAPATVIRHSVVTNSCCFLTDSSNFKHYSRSKKVNCWRCSQGNFLIAHHARNCFSRSKFSASLGDAGRKCYERAKIRYVRLVAAFDCESEIWM